LLPSHHRISNDELFQKFLWIGCVWWLLMLHNHLMMQIRLELVLTFGLVAPLMAWKLCQILVIAKLTVL
jgi:hypothetical protein